MQRGNSGKLIFSLAVVGALSVGCGQGMTALGMGSDFSSKGNNLTPAASVAKVETETMAAEAALEEAEAALDGVVVGDHISVPAGNGNLVVSAVGTQSLTGVSERLEKMLNRLYDKLKAPIERAKVVIAQVRAQLAAALAKLDPNVPAQADLIKKMTDMLARIDALEARLADVYMLMADKVNQVVLRVDTLIARLDPTNPLMALAISELKDVERVLIEFRDKLAST